MIRLKGKNILFISVSFFNYENIIRERLIEHGASVDFFDERPSNSFYAKAIIRLKKRFYHKRINNYYKTIISEIGDKQYDYFLLIKGEVIPRFFLEFIKNKNIKSIYYTYDSFANNPNGLSVLKYFTNKFTFDNGDADKYNLTLRPLFFSNDYRKLGSSKESKYTYDLAFIGTAHSDRYLISEKLREWVVLNKMKSYTFYYSPSKLLFKYNKIFKATFKGFDKSKISFKSMQHDQIIDVYRNSKVVLDINHPNQKGLTMRTFECLGAKRKLITTNQQIKNYTFYKPENIFVIDRRNLKVDFTFFESEFVDVDDRLYYSMSIDGWIEDLFFDTPKKDWLVKELIYIQ